MTGFLQSLMRWYSESSAAGCHCNRFIWIEACYDRHWFPWYHYWRCLTGYWKCVGCFYSKIIYLAIE